jgi:TonB family protein
MPNVDFFLPYSAKIGLKQEIEGIIDLNVTNLPVWFLLLAAVSLTAAAAEQDIKADPSDAALQQDKTRAVDQVAERGGIETEIRQVWSKINLAERLGLSACYFLDSFYAINKAWHGQHDARDIESRLTALSKEVDDLLVQAKGRISEDAQTGKVQNAPMVDSQRLSLGRLRWKINLAWGNGVGIKTYCTMFNSIFATYCTGSQGPINAQLDSLEKALDNQLAASKNIREALGMSVATLVGARVVGFDYQPFMAYLQRRIKLGWYPPQVEATYQLKTKFLVQKTGEIADIKLENRSGTAEFDDAAVCAIKSASPLLRPEVDPRESLKLEFTFDYRNRKPKALPTGIAPATTR